MGEVRWVRRDGAWGDNWPFRELKLEDRCVHNICSRERADATDRNYLKIELVVMQRTRIASKRTNITSIKSSSSRSSAYASHMSNSRKFVIIHSV